MANIMEKCERCKKLIEAKHIHNVNGKRVCERCRSSIIIEEGNRKKVK